MEERQHLVDEALADQAQRTSRFVESIGTTGELSAYLRLRAAGKRVGDCDAAHANAQPDLETTWFCFSVTPEPAAASASRGELSRRLDGLIEALEMDDALLLLSELVTNAYLNGHAPTDGTIDIEAHLGADTLWVGVTNRGPSFDYSPRTPSPDAQRGRGLFLVNTLASNWGIAHASDSTSVWFELDHQGSTPSVG